jgi:hypothetical protein
MFCGWMIKHMRHLEVQLVEESKRNVSRKRNCTLVKTSFVNTENAILKALCELVKQRVLLWARSFSTANADEFSLAEECH